MKTSGFQKLFYLVAKNLIQLTGIIGWRLQALNLHHIPKEGRFIVAANHRSLADPPFVGCVCPRRMHFLAKRDLFKFAPFAWVIRMLNAHPISRAGGAQAIKLAEVLLAQGEGVILFPEGTRQKTDEIGPARAGVGRLALKTKSPVIPAYIHNSGHLKEMKKLIVSFGTPIQPDGFKTYEELSQAVMEEIKNQKRLILQGKF